MTEALVEDVASSPNIAEDRLPGEVGIWVFVFGDMLVFSLFFVTFLFYRIDDVDLYRSSQAQLNLFFGLLNTIVLLSSSWLVATAVQLARQGREKTPSILFYMGFLCGAVFLIIKFFEYSEKIVVGINIATNDFFMYYFVFTGIHALHLTIGMGVLFYLAKYSSARPAPMPDTEIQTLESGALFWHLVDLLWIILFALLYLLN